ncbi:hypothetical protein Q2K19_22125 [Micromonospora soli]|uniref:hypothetical protein n=1 Tax=Micromonospora sp. NBRC 110009 TaxID=3061627 RepID=UPI002671FADD|nr:hypothetical protein [Micromonospora sp. NBRC 110009]WKT96874.1 hypothetical protein Q2K19_22125 [Micromonospora sp. NBRC 110009]
MSGPPHGMALRAPWYALVRSKTDRFGPEALAPYLQKYDSEDFVATLVADPQRSLRWTRGDRWSFPVQRPVSDPVTLRGVLSPYKMVRSPIRKLYQPSHQRFYAVTAELFCDVAGLPRPGPGDTGVTVRFVMRRTLVTFTGDPAELRAAAKAIAKADFHDERTEDVAAAFRSAGLADLPFKAEEQAWYVGADGRGEWRPVAADLSTEQTFPMWRIPRPANDCVPGPGRSLWFGVVPTYSGDTDATGRPKLDERTTYHLRVVASKGRPQPCPPIVTVSAPSVDFRLADFFDPAGTANRRVRVRLPDLQAMQAHAAGSAAVGGVEFERPAGSQLPPFKLGKVPDSGDKSEPGGTTPENCFHAIELITIVATFVLGIFMPIVIFVFQLWWMLLLKFCVPPDAGVLAALATLNGNKSMGDLTPQEREDLSTLLGCSGEEDLITPMLDAHPELKATGPQANQLAKDFAAAVQAAKSPQPPKPKPLPDVEDPLCPVVGTPTSYFDLKK